MAHRFDPFVIIVALIFSFACSSTSDEIVIIEDDNIYVGDPLPTGLFRDENLPEKISNIISAYRPNSEYAELRISYPYHQSVFPLDATAPALSWMDKNPESTCWLIIISRAAAKRIFILSEENHWKANDILWNKIKASKKDHPIAITILGIASKPTYRVQSKGRISITISKYRAGAPIFYQQMPLPFSLALKKKHLSRWRLGDISSPAEPRTVLSNLTTCGNCHTFSGDGRTFGMDIDYQADKGAYALAPVAESMVLSKERFISWNRIRVPHNIDTNMGLFSKISATGDYVISTINDKPFMVVIDDLYFSQLFFPITGVLAYYHRETQKFSLLPGADDPAYIQTSPAWSPDDNYIVFARAPVNQKLIERMGNKRVLTVNPNIRINTLNRKYRIQYDLYRIPFNNGRGGKPEPLTGASLNGRSNYFPRFSPDGKWIVFNQSDTGLVAQPSSQLFIVPSEGGAARRMRCNTDLYNSWHSWSPNSRWIVFSSKTNGPHTEIFMAHVDENGVDYPPVRLTQFNTKGYAALMPEFVNIAADAIREIKVYQ